MCNRGRVKEVIAFLLLLLVFTSVGAIAAEAVASAPVVTSSGEPPMYVQIIVGIFGTIFTMFIVPFLRNSSEAAKARLLQHQIDSSKSLLEQKQQILDMLQEFALSRAASIGEKRWPILAGKIMHGKMNEKSEIKEELKEWGEDLKQECLDYFSTQNIDLIKLLGESAIDQAIEFAANKVSPFPGKETAVHLLKDGAAKLLVDHGVDWVRDHMNASAQVVPVPIDPEVKA
jgi:hypothetical protein